MIHEFIRWVHAIEKDLVSIVWLFIFLVALTVVATKVFHWAVREIKQSFHNKGDHQ